MLINYGEGEGHTGAFYLVRTHLGGGGGSSLLYMSIAYYMQKGGGWVQIACKIAYVLKLMGCPKTKGEGETSQVLLLQKKEGGY